MNKLYVIGNAFMLGICLEYIYRVKVSPFPIIISILLTIGILVDLTIDYVTHIKAKKTIISIQETMKVSEKSLKVPKGWIVNDTGQKPSNMLWYVQLIKLGSGNVEELGEHVYVEDYDTYEEALKNAINEIKLVDKK